MLYKSVAPVGILFHDFLLTSPQQLPYAWASGGGGTGEAGFYSPQQQQQFFQQHQQQLQHHEELLRRLHGAVADGDKQENLEHDQHGASAPNFEVGILNFANCV